MSTKRAIKHLARRFARWWHRERAAEVRRLDIARELMPLIKRSGGTSVSVGDGCGCGSEEAVQLMVQERKWVTKKDLVRAFGAEAAQKFWGELAPRVSEYLTVVLARVEAARG